MSETELTTNITRERIKKYLEEGKRFDSRNAEEFREIEITIGISKNAEGSASVRIGKTEVIVGVKMSIEVPYPDSPNKGNLSVNTELLPLSSSRFENGPPKFDAIELSRIVDRGIRESNYIEFEKLCIKEGEKVWTVFIDIYSINDDGNLIDAAGIAAIAALKTAKIPKYDPENYKVMYGELSEKKIPLKKEIIIPVTVHKIGENFIVDPTKEEEDISEVRVTIGSSTDEIIASIQKGNSKPIKTEEFYKIIEISERVHKDIFKKIEKFLK